MRPFTPAQISDGVLAVSDDLSAKVTSALSKHSSGVLKEISGYLKKGLFQEAKTVASELEFTEALKKTEKVFRKFSQSAALVGAGAVDKPNTSIMVNGGGFPFEVDVSAVRQMQNSINKGLTSSTRRRMLNLIDRAMRFEKAAEPIDPEALANDINRFLRGEIRRVVDVSANITGTRVASYGMLHEARARGISRYRIDAVLDDRTTDICRNMHGRIFTVEAAYSRTQSLLSITDPNTLKSRAPFPAMFELEDTSDADLQAAGIDVPPFHFLCRSVVTLLDTTIDQGDMHPPVPEFPREVTTPDLDTLEAFFQDRWPQIRDTFGVKPDSFLDYEDDLVKAVRDYTGSTYRPINEALRANRKPDYEEVATTIREMDKAFKKAAPGKEDLFVYRGVDASVTSRMEIGKVFQDDGFISTTVRPGFAKNWSKTVMQIYVPKDAPHIPVDAFSKNPGEYEIILARSSQFRVIGKDNAIIDGQEVSVIRLVWQGVGSKNDWDKLGTELPPLESVVKDEQPRRDKFVWSMNDLREASMSG